MPEVELQIGVEDDGRRLDVVLVERIAEMSRSRVRVLTTEGLVHVNGRPARKGRTLVHGDQVTVESIPPPANFSALPDPSLEIEVLLETDLFVVINKKAGMPSHPLCYGETGTLANALVARYPEMKEIGYSKREPGLVHRLDTYTSGLLLAARTRESFETLVQALRDGKIQKRYQALCLGEVQAPQSISIPLANHPSDKRKVIVCGDPQEAERLRARLCDTEILSAEQHGEYSLVELSVPTAFRHQIRVHLAKLGHPLLGDTLYGGPELEGSERHYLHASQISFPHPESGEAMRVESKADFVLVKVS